jgi:hypothetical protein
MSEGNTVIVVFAYEKGSGNEPWIYGIYQNHSEGLDVLEQMQESKEYGHLTWDNRILPIE